jgi:PBP1b-binding outer membrane lipoprotein LpoB
MKRLTVLCVGALLLTGCAGPSAPVSTTPVTSQADVAGPTRIGHANAHDHEAWVFHV